MLPKDYLIIALLSGNFVFLWWLKNMVVCLLETFMVLLEKSTIIEAPPIEEGET
jgi:hypothetical protein